MKFFLFGLTIIVCIKEMDTNRKYPLTLILITNRLEEIKYALIYFRQQVKLNILKKVGMKLLLVGLLE